MDINATLAERGNTHGDFIEQARLSQSFKGMMQASDNWDNMPTFQQEALQMIAVKMSRILTGNNWCHDHWHDVAGYAQLVANALEKDNA